MNRLQKIMINFNLVIAYKLFLATDFQTANLKLWIFESRINQ